MRLARPSRHAAPVLDHQLHHVAKGAVVKELSFMRGKSTVSVVGVRTALQVSVDDVLLVVSNAGRPNPATNWDLNSFALRGIRRPTVDRKRPAAWLQIAIIAANGGLAKAIFTNGIRCAGYRESVR